MGSLFDGVKDSLSTVSSDEHSDHRQNLRLECARIAAILMSGSDGGSAIAMVGKAELIYNYVLNGQRPNEGNQSD